VFAQTSSEDRTQFDQNAWAVKKRSCKEGLNSAKPQGGVTIRTTYLLGAVFGSEPPLFRSNNWPNYRCGDGSLRAFAGGRRCRLVFDAMPHGFRYVFDLGIQGSARSAGELP
jgi:hypothetical protein